VKQVHTTPSSVPSNGVAHQSTITPQQQQQQTSSDTITMIMVVILFLACNVLSLIVNVVETFFEPTALLINYLTDASNFLLLFNSSVNFVIYITFSPEYRKLFW
jgi:hypothetical protein